MTIRIRRLELTDDRSGFNSGNLELDRYFSRYAGQNQFRHHIGTTYVAIGPDEVIAGFATVAASEIRPARLPAPMRKRLPRYPVPVLRLARLAVDQRSKGKGVGTLLLKSVIALAVELAQSVGCLGVVVDAKPEAIAFYRTLGFVDLDTLAGQLGDRPEPTSMFLEIAQLAEED